jgi:4-alpha-glucanotransferase
MSPNRVPRRSSGVLLHPTSLPGPFGVGDLGPAAHRWLDVLSAAGQRWWQVLPVGPTGYGDSPYQSPSTFAGNVNLLSPEALLADGLVTPADAEACRHAAGPVPFETVIGAKRQLLAAAWHRFGAGVAPALEPEFRAFREAEKTWLDDYALFAAIKEKFGGEPWWKWPGSLAMREPAALGTVAKDLDDAMELDDAIATHRFGQFLFMRQWHSLRAHAHKLGIGIIGDVPIYVADDSVDVWSRPELYQLDANRRPRVVAGVPPDYFSPTGQLWGNPIYDWDAHRDTGFGWWVDRMKAALRLYDRVRIDHFRGIEGYWAVPAGDPTAQRGEWRRGPGDALLTALRDNLGEMPIIAEDLGLITPEVDGLRERFGLPGMRILQFAFGGAVEPRFLPHRFDRNLAVYTGTHDNDTTRGWYALLSEAEQDAYHRYLPEAEREPVWALIRAGWASVADLVIAPLQDLLGLGSGGRLNRPGAAVGNWRWRATDLDLTHPPWVERLLEFGRLYERG